MGFQILIIEDDKLIARYLSDIVSKFHRAFICHDLSAAKLALSNIKPDLVLTDLNLSKSKQFEGLEVIELCKVLDIPSIVLTSHGQEDLIQKAFEFGCSHYLVKDNFEVHIEKLIKTTLGDPAQKFIADHLQSTSKEYQSQAKYLFERSEDRDLPILLTGETGVGKTHLSQLLHDYISPGAPFIAKNLSELSDHILESELFGHKKGAFTGATEDYKGWIEQSSGGTLFLDEIGSLSLKAQQKLLKVIEEKTLTPVGSTQKIKVDFKLITATCDDLQEKIERGDFRIDFYFRIKGIEVNIPPLRSRIDDMDLALKKINLNQSRKIILTPEARDLLKNYQWPGNFRELNNVIKAIQRGRESFIEKSHIKDILPCSLSGKDEQKSALLTPKINNDILSCGLSESIKKIELEAFRKVVLHNGMKPNKVCSILKISKCVFYRLQAQMEIDHG